MNLTERLNLIVYIKRVLFILSMHGAGSSRKEFLIRACHNFRYGRKHSQPSATSPHSFGPYEKSNSASHSPVLYISKFLNRSKANLAASPHSPTIQLNTKPPPVAQPPTPTLSSAMITLNDDTLFHIMLLADKRTLGRCSQVCRIWYNLAMDALWRDGRHSGIRALLSYMDKFYEEPVDAIYKKRQAMLAASPSPACWTTFENQAGRRICAFTLDTKSLVVDPEFFNLLLTSAPDKINLPCLQKFRVIANQDGPELDIVEKFLTGGIIQHLELEIWDPVLDDKRALRVMQREAERGIPRFGRGSQPAPHAHPLADFFESIATYVPSLTHLAFAMRDREQMKTNWGTFLGLIFKLPKLETLQLPVYALTPEVISELAIHPSLEHLIVYESAAKTHRVTLSELCDTPFVPKVPFADSGNVLLEHLTDLAITASPTQVISFLAAQGACKLTRIRVIFSGPFAGAAEANMFFAALATAYPALQHLKLGPLLSTNVNEPPLGPDYKMLQPLERCSELVSLEIIAAYTSRFKDGEFVNLVSAWRYLRRLVLDHSGVLSGGPFEDAELSMGTAIWALRAFCPSLLCLFLYVSTNTEHSRGITASNTLFPATRSSFETVDLCIGYCPVSNPGQVARFLESTFRGTCRVKLHSTTRKVFDLTEATDAQMAWEDRRRMLSTFLKKVALARENIQRYRRQVLL
ncbi:hypothetical protein NM688_g4407 [Phlebia brevispora]|uniref:Uncharacterized protein n=1 Tax=Phlebia brevispora TaxID=194682 RepID=A0ACC1T366_9APHY|nr:hypothetical protein NM688_g4407 [Phlebia brevispora]